MGVIGAILGDISGSKYEFSLTHPKYKTNQSLKLDDTYTYSDDTVLSIAVVEAMNTDKDFKKAYIKYGRMFPDAGYGFGFQKWLNGHNTIYGESIQSLLEKYSKVSADKIQRKPYNSYGNGSAMRCSYIGQCYKNPLEQKDVELMAEKSAECTHNHPEGIKGAVTEAVCVWLAEQGKSKDYILNYGISQYPYGKYKFGCDVPVTEYHDKMTFHVSCQDSVPVAIRCFYDTSSFEDCMNLINSMECDTDTIGAIAGAICHSYYGKCFDDDQAILKKYLDTYLYNKLIQYKVIADESMNPEKLQKYL